MRNLNLILTVISGLFQNDKRITRKPMSRKLAAQVVADLAVGFPEAAIRRYLAGLGNDPDQIEAYMILALAAPLTERAGSAVALAEVAGKGYIAHMRKQPSLWQCLRAWAAQRFTRQTAQKVNH